MWKRIQQLIRLRGYQKQRVVFREHNRARKRYARYMKLQRIRFQQDVEQLERERDEAIRDERARVTTRLAELDAERRELVERHDALKQKLRLLENEIANVREIRARMEAAFTLVTRALGMANAAMDDIEKVDARVNGIKKQIDAQAK